VNIRNLYSGFGNDSVVHSKLREWQVEGHVMPMIRCYEVMPKSPHVGSVIGGSFDSLDNTLSHVEDWRLTVQLAFLTTISMDIQTTRPHSHACTDSGRSNLEQCRNCILVGSLLLLGVAGFFSCSDDDVVALTYNNHPN
jgi:hypothetical protein